MKNLSNQQRGLDGIVGVFDRPAPSSRFGWPPVDDGLCGKPDGDVAALPKCLVVGQRMGDLVTRLGDFVAATLVVLVRHGLGSVNFRESMPECCRTFEFIQQRQLS